MMRSLVGNIACRSPARLHCGPWMVAVLKAAVTVPIGPCCSSAPKLNPDVASAALKATDTKSALYRMLIPQKVPGRARLQPSRFSPRSRLGRSLALPMSERINQPHANLVAVIVEDVLRSSGSIEAHIRVVVGVAVIDANAASFEKLPSQARGRNPLLVETLIVTGVETVAVP